MKPPDKLPCSLEATADQLKGGRRRDRLCAQCNSGARFLPATQARETWKVAASVHYAKRVRVPHQMHVCSEPLRHLVIYCVVARPDANGSIGATLAAFNTASQVNAF